MGERSHRRRQRVNVTELPAFDLTPPRGAGSLGTMRGRATTLAVAVAVAASVTGCAGPSMSVGARIPSTRLAGMPAIGQTFSLDVDGALLPSDGMAARAEQSINDSINYQLHLHGARMFSWDAVRKLPNAQDFVEWSARSMEQIILELIGKSYQEHGSVAEFRYRGDLGTWRRILAADDLLISYFINGYDTRARATSWTVSEHAARRALACIVDLSDGRIVWCRFTDATTDAVLSRDGAQAVVDRLLDAMLARGDREARGGS
jgi:hypothetical protein